MLMLDGASALLIDASGLINLLAIQSPEKLLSGVGLPLVAAAPAAREVVRDPRKLMSGPARIADLESKRLLRTVDLEAGQLEVFMSLVRAEPPDDLDDGEAGTIACAHSLGCPLILDDGKARRIAAMRYPSLPVLFTVELLLHGLKAGCLTLEEVRQAINDARLLARMRIPFALRGRVSSVLGTPL